jgi:hypothetical protein
MIMKGSESVAFYRRQKNTTRCEFRATVLRPGDAAIAVVFWREIAEWTVNSGYVDARD